MAINTNQILVDARLHLFDDDDKDDGYFELLFGNTYQKGNNFSCYTRELKFNFTDSSYDSISKRNRRNLMYVIRLPYNEVPYKDYCIIKAHINKWTQDNYFPPISVRSNDNKIFTYKKIKTGLIINHHPAMVWKENREVDYLSEILPSGLLHCFGNTGTKLIDLFDGKELSEEQRMILESILTKYGPDGAIIDSKIPELLRFLKMEKKLREYEDAMKKMSEL